MNFRTLLSLLTIMISIASCTTNQKMFDPGNTQEEYVAFGTGGGFTGRVSKYYLTKKGDIYTKDGDTLSKIGSTSKTMVAQIFSNYQNTKLSGLKLNEPGNKYYFVEMNLADHKNIIKWGMNPLSDKTIETYHAILMNLIKKLNNQNNQSKL
jgi:hypothetical protein